MRERALQREGRFIPAGRWIACGLMLCLPAASVGAQGLREPEFMVQARRGFDDIYNLDYDQADQVFRLLKREVPRHPAPPLYLGVIVWLRELFHRQDMDLDRFLLARFFYPGNQQAMPAAQRKNFFDDIQECQMLARERLARNPRDADGRRTSWLRPTAMEEPGTPAISNSQAIFFLSHLISCSRLSSLTAFDTLWYAGQI